MLSRMASNSVECKKIIDVFGAGMIDTPINCNLFLSLTFFLKRTVRKQELLERMMRTHSLPCLCLPCLTNPSLLLLGYTPLISSHTGPTGVPKQANSGPGPGSRGRPRVLQRADSYLQPQVESN